MSEKTESNACQGCGAQREAGAKSGFRDRISLARLAWAKYREAVPDQPEQPPALFEAGFTLGMVMSGFREEQEQHGDD